jgi:hypothetical protein
VLNSIASSPTFTKTTLSLFKKKDLKQWKQQQQQQQQQQQTYIWLIEIGLSPKSISVGIGFTCLGNVGLCLNLKEKQQ